MCAASICFKASGRTTPEGWLPALNALKTERPLKFRMASAMIDRAELPVQRKRTLYCVGIVYSDQSSFNRSERRAMDTRSVLRPEQRRSEIFHPPLAQLR